MLTSLPIASAFRIAFLRRTPPENVPRGARAVVLLALAYALLPTLEAFLMSGGPGRFDIQSLSHALFPAAILLLASAVVAHLLGDTALWPRLAAAIFLGGLVIELAQNLLMLAFAGNPPPPERLGHALFIASLPSAWLAFALWRFAKGLGAIDRSRSRLVLAAALFFVTLPIFKVDYYPSLWQEDAPSAFDPAAFRVTREEVRYAQPRLLEESLAAVATDRPGTPDLYLLAVAGYGHQDVFMKEVEAVGTLFGERFGTAGRTVKLINNPKTAATVPFASVTSVRAALAAIGSRMGPEDVAFVFLTSHGSEQHRFTLELRPLQFDELTPAVLRQALDDARIRNRVVVVSSCFSGGFIEPLRGPNTLVITASAADRNSFGCTNTAEWTYFGKAYFDEALRATRSFTDAFEAAGPVILAREQKEKHDPSRPQMAVGEGIVPVLQALERAAPP